MLRQRVRLWNAVVWAVVMLAVAVVLKGVDGSVFVGVLPPDRSPGPSPDGEHR